MDKQAGSENMDFSCVCDDGFTGKCIRNTTVMIFVRHTVVYRYPLPRMHGKYLAAYYTHPRLNREDYYKIY